MAAGMAAGSDPRASPITRRRYSRSPRSTRPGRASRGATPPRRAPFSQWQRQTMMQSTRSSSRSFPSPPPTRPPTSVCCVGTQVWLHCRLRPATVPEIAVRPSDPADRVEAASLLDELPLGHARRPRRRYARTTSPAAVDSTCTSGTRVANTVGRGAVVVGGNAWYFVLGPNSGGAPFLFSSPSHPPQPTRAGVSKRRVRRRRRARAAAAVQCTR